MRELLLILIVIVLSIIALPKPLWGMYGYVWFGLMRPDVLAWSIDKYPYSFVLAITTLLGSLRHVGRLLLLTTNPICRWLVLLQVPLAVSAVFAQVPELCAAPFWYFERVVLMALLIPLLVRTEREFQMLFLIIAFSLGTLGVKFGAWGLLHGGVRFTQGYGGMLSGNNEIALGLAMATPLCWYARRLSIARWARWLFLAMTVGCIAAVVMTYSRGGALALTAALVLIIMRENRRLLTFVVIFVLAAPAVYLIHDTYFQRLGTLRNPTEESSAASRLEYAKAAFAMWEDYPLLGVGFGQTNYVRLSTRYVGRKVDQVVHNSYLQTLVDSGVVAFLVYVGLMFGTIAWLQASATRARSDNPEMVVYLVAIQTALVAFAVGSTFGSIEHYDFYYMLLMCAACCYEIIRERALEVADFEHEPDSVTAAQGGTAPERRSLAVGRE
jgi:probable O-glycosylation ligase (exosortase A-associated)